MAMNFDELPKDRPSGAFAVFEPGHYPAIVKNAMLMQSSTDGNTYMQVFLNCTNPTTGETALVKDNFFTSDKPLNKYKLRRFLEAIRCIPQGNFELADIVKIIVNKKLTVALKTEQNAGYAPRNVVNAFDDDIYYPAASTADVPFKFDAPDGAPNNDMGDASY